MPKCPHCKKDLGDQTMVAIRARTAHPAWKLVHSVVVLGIVVGWMIPEVNTWDDEPWMVAGIFFTVIIYAFGGDGLRFLQSLTQRRNHA